MCLGLIFRDPRFWDLASGCAICNARLSRPRFVGYPKDPDSPKAISSLLWSKAGAAFFFSRAELGVVDVGAEDGYQGQVLIAPFRVEECLSFCGRRPLTERWRWPNVVMCLRRLRDDGRRDSGVGVGPGATRPLGPAGCGGQEGCTRYVPTAGAVRSLGVLLLRTCCTSFHSTCRCRAGSFWPVLFVLSSGTLGVQVD